MRKTASLALLLALVLCLAACGRTETPTPSAAPSPSPSPSPTPFPEPQTQAAGPLYVDGKALESGRLSLDGEEYLLLSQAAEALGSELRREGEDFSFPWRKSEVRLRAGSSSVVYLDSEQALDAPAVLCQGGTDLLVPVESFCRAAQIGYYRDAEQDFVCCTPAAGDWALPENYTVVVMMYHAVGKAQEEANLIVDPYNLEMQFQWLLENDYTPIWFEDLWHVEDFSKPVILVFDDGYRDMYTLMYPLAKQYGVKVVVAPVKQFTDLRGGNYLDQEEILEMAASGLVSFESHSMTHWDLSEPWHGDPEPEIRDSKIWLTRLFKKEPTAFVYPIGGSTPEVQELVREHYRFGAKMGGEPWNTSDDPTMIYRFFVERHTHIYGYGNWLNIAFADETANNYVPDPQRVFAPGETPDD